MEPGRDDREEARVVVDVTRPAVAPLWSPVVTTGKSRQVPPGWRERSRPLWSPVVTTGKRAEVQALQSDTHDEPLWSPVVTTGKRSTVASSSADEIVPLWSPVVTTGKRRLPVVARQRA